MAEGPCLVPSLRAEGARATGPVALTGDRGPGAVGTRGAPLVGRAQDGADARPAERPRRGRGRGTQRAAASLGPRRALVSGHGDRAAPHRETTPARAAAA